MIKLIVVLAVATLALGAPKLKKSKHPLPDGRIVGGDDAKIEDYPYQLSLLRKNSHFCGAFIIDEKWALTAAQCTDGFQASDFKVRAGSDVLESGGQVIAVKAIHQNPYFNFLDMNRDISVLELTEPIKLGTTAAVIKLVPSKFEPKAGAEATVSGWGVLHEGEDFSKQLQVIKIPIIDRVACNGAVDEDITEYMICAGLPEGGKDACQGDSGGPLVIDGKVAGIASWGYGCAQPGIPGIYSNIGTLGDFVRNVTGLDL